MTEKISDNVGKKIVEALKMHDSIVEEPLSQRKQNSSDIESDIIVEKENIAQNTSNDTLFTQSANECGNNDFDSSNLNSAIDNNDMQLNINSVLQNAIKQNLGNTNLQEIQSDFEYPNNVAILNHLIAKLPAGVTKQTGAIIIKQTMEALGIPMKSVIIEAQQVQESLVLKTKECQQNIIECRKQIASLEIKVQQYQRQAIVMNDIINLFMSTGV